MPQLKDSLTGKRDDDRILVMETSGWRLGGTAEGMDIVNGQPLIIETDQVLCQNIMGCCLWAKRLLEQHGRYCL